jgi:hypothetical protein
MLYPITQPKAARQGRDLEGPSIDSCALCSVFIKRSPVLCGSTGPDGSSTPRAEGRLRGPSDPAGPQDPMGLRPRWPKAACEVFDPAGRRPPAAGRRRPARSIGPIGSCGPDGSSTPRRLIEKRSASHSKSRPCGGSEMNRVGVNNRTFMLAGDWRAPRTKQRKRRGCC